MLGSDSGSVKHVRMSYHGHPILRVAAIITESVRERFVAHMYGTQQAVTGWGRYITDTCHVYRPGGLGELDHVAAGGGRAIARGLGRSYGDPAQIADGQVLTLDWLDRFRSFDEPTGELDAECGVSLGEILRTFVPRGWFLHVTPGTRHVTLGGAIAADVHGKNHHCDGSFAQSVIDFDLIKADGEVVTCSRETNAELFWATIGGMGLTGVIRRARIRLRRIETAYVNTQTRRAANLDEAFELFAAEDGSFRYSVAWIDCLAKGKSLGRCVLMRGDHARLEDLPPKLRRDPLAMPRRKQKNVPIEFPPIALNRLSVAAFNKLYYRMHGDGRKVVHHDGFFFPLDAIDNWNRIYGKRGFVQYQPELPPDQARDGMVKILERIASAGCASFLAVFKTMGPQGEGMLSYPMPGATLALDMPNTGKSLRELLAELDRIVLDHGGRLYLAKDAAMSAESFAQMYPRLDEFRQVKARVDPTNRFVSSQAIRLGIVKQP